MRSDHLQIAERLYQAEHSRTAIAPVSAAGEWTIADAYAVQQHFVTLKQAGGARRVGRKVGLTSQAMQKMLGVHEPDFGVLLDSMDLSRPGTCSLGSMLQAKVEPEIAFRLGRDLRGPGVNTLDALVAIDLAFPALEVIDSRIADWKISIYDTVADNASSAFFAIAGDGVPVQRLDLAAQGLEFWRNGEIIATGSGSAILGHPAAAVAWLANTLAAHGEYLRAGEIVLPGALVGACPITAGDRFRATFRGIGEIELGFMD